MKNGTDSSKPGYITKLVTVTAYAVETLGRILSEADLDYWIDHKKELRGNLYKSFSKETTYRKEREDWTTFYLETFGWRVNLQNVLVPEKPQGRLRYRLLFFPKGLQLASVLKAQLPFIYVQLSDPRTIVHTRSSERAYAVWVVDDKDILPEFQSVPVSIADPTGTTGINVLECIVLHLKFFKETGVHIEGTSCSGSHSIQDSNTVLCLRYWADNKVTFDWSPRDGRSRGIRQIWA